MANKVPEKSVTRSIPNQSDWAHCRLLDRVDYIPPNALRPCEKHARKHTPRKIQKLARAIKKFGIVAPLLAKPDGTLIAGHALLRAADLAKVSTIPVVWVDHLSDAEITTLRIALNRLAEDAEWDQDKLAIEFQHLLDLEFDVSLTGFEIPEIDLIIEGALAPASDEPADRQHAVPEHPVTRIGDLWQLGENFILCGDARKSSAYEKLLQGQKAQLVFTDPPYNVRIDGNVGGKGSIKPPKNSQFKPGQSGNPKGRPKGAKNFSTELLEELHEKIEIKEAGKPKKVSKQRGMIKALAIKALSGDARAANIIFGMLLKVTGDTDEKLEEINLTEIDKAILSDLEKEVLKQAKSKGAKNAK